MVHRTNLELEQVDKVARKLSSPRKSCFGEYSDATVCETLTMKGLWRSLNFLYLGSILSLLSKRNSCSKRLKELGYQFVTNVNYYCEAFDVSHNDGHFLPLLSLFRALFRSTHACFPVSFPNTCGSSVVCVVRSNWYWRPQRVVFQVRFKRVSLYLKLWNFERRKQYGISSIYTMRDKLENSVFGSANATKYYRLHVAAWVWNCNSHKR